MATRQEFLERIRKALGREPTDSPTPPKLEGVFPPLAAVLEPIPPGQVVEKFEAELQKVSGCTSRAANAKDLEGILRKVMADQHAQAVVLSRNPMLARLGIAQKLKSWGISVASWGEEGNALPSSEATLDFRKHVFAAEVGITGVEFVLAESGTLVLTSCTEGAQLASLAPPVHVALYRRSQVIATLEEIFEGLSVPRDPGAPLPGRSVVLITGPSRTADIEQILIRGVHGPKEVHAILVEETCFT